VLNFVWLVPRPLWLGVLVALWGLLMAMLYAEHRWFLSPKRSGLPPIVQRAVRRVRNGPVTILYILVGTLAVVCGVVLTAGLFSAVRGSPAPHGSAKDSLGMLLVGWMYLLFAYGRVRGRKG
jgi:hypothetical protein